MTRESRATAFLPLLLLGVLRFASPAAAQLTDLGAHVLDECAAPGDCAAFERFGSGLATGDFDDDGFEDLAVGVPHETVGGDQLAGAVHVYYGSIVGLTSLGEQIFHQNVSGVGGVPEPGDTFGAALAVGDFDFDGFDDLAIGVDGEDFGETEDVGMITVLFGSPDGLVTAGSLDIGQDNLPPGSAESSEAHDAFGFTLAASDDGTLAIGVVGEDFVLPNETNAGLVQLLTSSGPGNPLDAASEREQNDFLDECGAFDGNELDEFWGTAMVLGRFGPNPSLVVAGRHEDHSGESDAGRVTVMFGSTLGCFDQNTPGVLGSAEAGDDFGSALAVGDFDDDGFEDLAIGIPGEDTLTVDSFDAGAVQVLFGSSGGLTTSDDLVFDERFFPLTFDLDDVGDHFGEILASGDFDGDGFSDLAIGVPDEDVGATVQAGTVHATYGSASGFALDDNQTFHSDFPPGMPDSLNADDLFGAALAAGDFDGNGTDDLAIGMPGEDLGTQASAGAVTVLYGLDRDSGGFGTVHFNSSAVSFPEDPGTRIVVILRDGGAVLSASVEHSRTGGSATPGVDFNYTPGVSSWAVGDLSFEIFGVQILGDTLDENNETVVLRLSDPSAGLGLGSPSTLTFTIQDDDEGGVVQFQLPAQGFLESAGSVPIVVTRTGGAASGATVQYTTVNGSAAAGEDFVAESGTITFDAGVNARAIEVALVDDPTDEPAESFTLTLSNPTGGAQLGARSSTIVAIADDDPTGQIFLDSFESGDTSAWS